MAGVQNRVSVQNSCTVTSQLSVGKCYTCKDIIVIIRFIPALFRMSPVKLNEVPF